jgi:hypothetical protein
LPAAWLEGCVTLPPDVFGNRVIYIQNANQGLRVELGRSGGNFPSLKLGDRISLRDISADKWSAHAIEISAPEVIEQRGTCGAIAPLAFATGAVNSRTESLLIQVSGRVVSVNGREIELDDGSGSVLVTLDPAMRLSIPTGLRGQTVRVTGIVMTSGNRVTIVPRYASDLTLPPAPTASTRTRTISPVTSTRPATPRASTTARPPRTPTPARRAQAPELTAGLLAPLGQVPVDGTIVAVAGGAASIATGFASMLMGIVLMARRKR